MEKRCLHYGIKERMNKRKKIILTFTILLVLQVVIWLSTYLYVKNVLYFDDSLEIAQTARSILEGRGFSLLSYPLPGLDILHKYGFRGNGMLFLI